MDVADLVRSHYGGEDLEAGILAGLAAAGVDTDRLTVDDLAAVDQLHAGFAPATRYLEEQLNLTSSVRLLDIGCGIGGPARMAAARYHCSVTGVDLSPQFVHTARALTARVGLADLARYDVASGDQLDSASGSFDRAMMIHVGMNISAKAAVFTEVRRVLRPGGLFAVYEQMRLSDGEFSYPLPWAEDDRSSFLASPADYARDLEAAGFTIIKTEDRTMATARPPGPQPRVTPAAVFGPDFVERLRNNVTATRAGVLAPVLIMAQAR